MTYYLLIKVQLIMVKESDNCKNVGFIWNWKQTFHPHICIHVSCTLLVRILRPNCPLLKRFGHLMPYETAVGMNGRIWVKGRSTVETITIANIISDSETISDSDMKTFVKTRVHTMSGLT